MEHNMILSASGWRKVFAESGNENDFSEEIGKDNRILCVHIAENFASFLKEQTKKRTPSVTVAKDTRPTGKQISQIFIKALFNSGIKVHYIGTASAPEIMAYSRCTDGFVYISASHNPVGHNGIKFGLNDGGVMDGEKSKLLIKQFNERLSAVNAVSHAEEVLSIPDSKIQKIIKKAQDIKNDSLKSYKGFIKEIITGEKSEKKQKDIFERIKFTVKNGGLSVAADMNGSARTVSIDKAFFAENEIPFVTINDEEGKIVHGIIPEGKNLESLSSFMERLALEGKPATLGYMPDCDGDRGNTVFMTSENKAKVLSAQEGFALCTATELAFETWKHGDSFFGKSKLKKLAVCVNCPTSMRIDEICSAFNARLFRAEVGEANVVNLSKEKRKEGFNVRILGEGSNGGNITPPSSVRDPLCTVFAILKMLALRDNIEKNGSIKKGLFHIWCEKSGQEKKYKSDFTIEDIIKTLPAYTTTGVSESRAVLKVECTDMGKLKLRFQKFFEESWKERKAELKEKYGLESYDCCTTNGTKEIQGASDWSNGRGGLKVRFFDREKRPCAYIWMRPSGTESVFRILCDVKGDKPQMEASLLEWETSLLKKADEI